MFDVDATDTALQLFITLEVKDVVDQFSLAKKKHWVVIGTCFVGFLFGLPMCTSSCFYMFELLDL